MTRANVPQGGTDERGRAAVIFTGLMTVLAGGAGLAVAGLILGFDYLLHGQPSERDALAEDRAQRRHDRYEDALAWLEADRADRVRHRARVRDWFGQDPATRGDRPSSGETFGRAWARAWNATRVGWSRFRNGWRTGRDEARARRDNGDSHWWRRPDQPDPQPAGCLFCGRTDRPLVYGGQYCDICMGPEFQQPQPDAGGGGGRPVNEPPPIADPSEPIDAEIVPDDEAPAARPVVLVGADETAPAQPASNYDGELDTLRAEVEQNGNTRNDNPSPPLSALR